MARYTGPKDKLSRREGVDLFGKGARLTRLTVPPGQHGHKGTRKISQYGKQLREKQKVKRIYGILERQFKLYVDRAVKSRRNTGEELLTSLERRLDNVVYRLGFAPTRPASRQVVGHGHVFVNGKRVNIPSFQIKVGDVITLTPKGQQIPAVLALINDKNVTVGAWLSKEGTGGKVDRLPQVEDVTEIIDIQRIVEFYSR